MQEQLQPNQPNLLKQIRLRMGMTQQEFADMLGVSQGNVGHYELRGQTMPPDVARFLIMKAADRGHRVTYEDIYGPVHAPVLTPRARREILEITERRARYAED
jgi:putative transcriptional regulator